MADATAIRRVVKEYILNEFLCSENPDSLRDDTPLISGSILDSIGIMKLVIFLEETYEIEFLDHEVGVDSMNTLADITQAVHRKIERRG